MPNLAAEGELHLESISHVSPGGDGGGQRATWANGLYRFTSGTRQVEVIPESSAHGASIIDAEPSQLIHIIAWLADTL